MYHKLFKTKLSSFKPPPIKMKNFKSNFFSIRIKSCKLIKSESQKIRKRSYSDQLARNENSYYLHNRPKTKQNKEIKIAVAMSGGVDSTLAAYMLQKDGYEIEGVFMQSWESNDDDVECPEEMDWKLVKRICEKLKIKCTRINLVKEYWTEVFSKMLEGYKDGNTPNPDILCNQKIKFDEFYDQVFEKTGFFFHSKIK